jgi:two-component system response regulator
MGSKQIRVIIVDNHPVVLEDVQEKLESMPGVLVDAVCGGGQEAADLAARQRPDIILVGLHVPVMGDIALMQRIIMACDSRVRVVALASSDDDETFHQALRVGVAGFILRTSSPWEIMHTIRHVCLGDSVISPRLISRVLSRYGPGLPLDGSVATLEENEFQLLSLVGMGLNNMQIADRLHFAESTIKSYVSRLMRKLHVQSRTQLVVLAFQNGVVTVDRASREWSEGFSAV